METATPTDATPGQQRSPKNPDAILDWGKLAIFVIVASDRPRTGRRSPGVREHLPRIIRPIEQWLSFPIAAPTRCEGTSRWYRQSKETGYLDCFPVKL